MTIRPIETLTQVEVLEMGALAAYVWEPATSNPFEVGTRQAAWWDTGYQVRLREMAEVDA